MAYLKAYKLNKAMSQILKNNINIVSGDDVSV